MEAEKEYQFTAAQLAENLAAVAELGVTRLTVADAAITGSAGRLLNFALRAQNEAPDLFYKFHVTAAILDGRLCEALSSLYCSLQLPLDASVLAARKSFERKIGLLNGFGLVFGFDLDFAADEGDSLRLFRDRLNLALSLYPNHIDFPRLTEALPPPTKSFSSRDIAVTADRACACVLFYSAGRAVPWFLSVLKPLRISADRFFSDFAEWLGCNNVDLGNRDPYRLGHREIEGMQLAFLKLKYEEKGLDHLYDVVRELVRFNGAFARLVGEDEEAELDLRFHPQDLGYAQDVEAFAENVCMEQCRVRLRWMQDREGNNYPDWELVG